ncbi:electron transfer flavoprotein subunit alpha/FixB family protein [Actinomyces culturomici]|uniref:electron transfer flavoprotein subunit alpha/FixB family protein n=1 Tax=Actinomyces culturomici TaxID=1926276 RepID=UPI000E200DB6|nr:electron transfer flavoprotein subunit alpha/FixB family protein [Actinomyces culturomici]
MSTLSTPILVLADHQGSDAEGWTLSPASAQVLTLARTLTSADVVAVSLTSTPDLGALGALGVAKVLVPGLDDAAPRVSALVGDAVAACLSTDAFGALLLASSYRGREVAARISALVDSGVVADAVALEADGEALIATTTALAGSWSNRLRVSGPTPIAVVRPGSVDVETLDASVAPAVIEVPVAISAEAGAVEVVSSTAQSGDGRVSLSDASTVVVAGRGTNGDMSVVESLADELGAAIGATRVVCDEGWAPRAMQIGQTGASISPNVYIGLGVSGAIHHTVGMQSSAHIVAVCDDPDAPIFEIADFGVVGDLFEVVPQALEALRAAR